MMLLNAISLFFTLVTFARASSITSANARHVFPAGTEAQTIYQFSNGTWVENIAIRANGNLLVTLIDRPELYEIDTSNPTGAKLVYRFSEYTSLLGIAEATPGVFAVIAGNFTRQTGPGPESFSVWKVDFHRRHKVKVSKITDIPEAVFLDGLVTLDPKSGVVLVGDASRGVVFRVDTRTGKYAVVLRDETFKPPPNAPLPVGLNGIRIFEKHMYYVNTFNPLYGRVPIDTVTGEATGPYELISTGVPADDFSIDRNGIAYIAGGTANIVTKVELSGKSTVIAGNLNSSLVAAGTSAVFGRTRKDKHILYVTTGGASESPVNGTFSEGGKIVALTI